MIYSVGKENNPNYGAKSWLRRIVHIAMRVGTSAVIAQTVRSAMPPSQDVSIPARNDASVLVVDPPQSKLAEAKVDHLKKEGDKEIAIPLDNVAVVAFNMTANKLSAQIILNDGEEAIFVTPNENRYNAKLEALINFVSEVGGENSNSPEFKTVATNYNDVEQYIYGLSKNAKYIISSSNSGSEYLGVIAKTKKNEEPKISVYETKLVDGDWQLHELLVDIKISYLDYLERHYEELGELKTLGTVKTLQTLSEDELNQVIDWYKTLSEAPNNHQNLLYYGDQRDLAIDLARIKSLSGLNVTKIKQILEHLGELTTLPGGLQENVYQRLITTITNLIDGPSSDHSIEVRDLELVFDELAETIGPESLLYIEFIPTFVDRGYDLDQIQFGFLKLNNSLVGETRNFLNSYLDALVKLDEHYGWDQSLQIIELFSSDDNVALANISEWTESFIETGDIDLVTAMLSETILRSKNFPSISYYKSIYNYFLYSHNAGRNWSEITNDEIMIYHQVILQHIDTLKTLGLDAVIFEENLNSFQALAERIPEAINNLVLTDKTNRTGFYNGFGNFLNTIHNTDVLLNGSDQTRFKIIDGLAPESLFWFIVENGLQWTTFSQTGIDGQYVYVSPTYTSNYIAAFDRLKNLNEFKTYIQESPTETLVQLSYSLGRYGLLAETVGLYPQEFIEPMEYILLHEKDIAKITRIPIVYGGIQAGLNNYDSSGVYQKMIMDLYYTGDIESKAIAMYILKNNYEIFKLNHSDRSVKFVDESADWHDPEESNAPELISDMKLSSILYYDKNTELQENSGYPYSLSYFKQLGYEVSNLDDNNWVMKKNNDLGVEILILVTFDPPEKAKLTVDRLGGNHDKTFTALLAHSGEVGYMLETYDFGSNLMYLGGCGSSTHNLMYYAGYQGQIISIDGVAYPKVSLQIIANVLEQLAVGNRDWREIDKSDRISSSYYTIRWPDQDPTVNMIRYVNQNKKTGIK